MSSSDSRTKKSKIGRFHKNQITFSLLYTLVSHCNRATFCKTQKDNQWECAIFWKIAKPPAQTNRFLLKPLQSPQISLRLFVESPPLFFKSPLVSTSSPQETFQSPPLITNRSKLPHSIFRQNQTLRPKNKRTIIFSPHTPHPQPQTKDTNQKETTTYSE